VNLDYPRLRTWLDIRFSRLRRTARASIANLREYWSIWGNRRETRWAIMGAVGALVLSVLALTIGQRTLIAFADGFQGRRAERAAPVAIVNRDLVPELLGGPTTLVPHLAPAEFADLTHPGKPIPPWVYHDDDVRDPWRHVLIIGGLGEPPHGSGGSGYTY
jgi:hypothetical protein